MFPYTFPNIYRLEEIVVPTVTTQTVLTISKANAGLSDEEKNKVDGVKLLGIRTSAGAFVAPTGGKIAISGDNIVINEPTAGFTTGDVYLVAFTMGGFVPRTGGVAS